MQKDYNGLEIAVIGMSCKFPQSDDISTFWENLKKGKELITFFTEKELAEAGINEKLLQDPNYVKASGYLEESEYFDSAFFGYTPDEAEVMDIQMRHFHEQAWNALEDASCIPNKYDGLIGVYAGASSNFNWEATNLLKGKNTWENSSVIDKDHIATSVAYKLNLKGPALTLYTACSTSLVAINSACLGILSGQCDVAIAGGVTIQPSKAGYMHRDGMINSPDGHNRTFDEKAGGTVAGNGIGVVVLKRLQDAIDDGNHIYAIVKGSAINNDGNRKVGFTAPSIEGQVEVIRGAFQMAEVEPDSVGYVECHGTATNLGDPVEVEALKLAFNSNKRNYCALGSVKSNTGHLDSAAGVIGFIKAVLCLKNRMLVPTLHFNNLNPKIEIENSPFYVNTETKTWSNDKYPLRAGVTSLGVGGTNAHVILEEYLPENKDDDSDSENIVVLSAKTRKALDRNIDGLKSFILENNVSFSKLSNTLQNGREEFNYRAMFVSDSKSECYKILNNDISGRIRYGNIKANDRPLVFMYSGQGSQYIDMGKELYKEEVFRIELDKCFKILEEITGNNFKEILYPDDCVDVELAISRLNRMDYTGPIKFAIEYALSKLLYSYGVEPDILIGHSFGEYVAATLCGIFKLEDALKLSVIRGHLMNKSVEGCMMNVPLSEAELKPYLNDEISLAAVNTSSLCIVSGKKEDLKELFDILLEKDIECMMLNVERGGHSYLMDEILEEFEAGISEIKLSEPDKHYISGMLGRKVYPGEICNHQYWINHIRNEVRFFDGVAELCNLYENAIFIEVSPGKGLSLFVNENQNRKETHDILNMLRHHKDVINDKRFFYERLGILWTLGVKIKWDNLYKKNPGLISLPGYSFDKYIYKVEGIKDLKISKILAGMNQSGALQKEYKDWFYIPSWRRGERLNNSCKIIPNKKYLIFSTETSAEDSIKEFITNQGGDYIEVKIGNKYNKINDKSYQVNYTIKDDFIKLLNDIKNSDFNIDNILYLWTCYNRNKDATYKDIEYAHYICFKTIVYFLQSFAENDYLNEVSMLIVTTEMESFNGEEELYYEKSLVNGLVKTISSEFGNIECKLLDVKSNDLYEDNTIKSIFNFLNSDNKEEKIGLKRDKFIWYKYYEKILVEKTCSDIENFDGKNILIVGGLTGIGYKVAEDFAKRYKNINLIVIGRSRLPDKKNWDEIIANNKDENLIKRIQNMLALENSGSTISYHDCDISNINKLKEVIDKIEKNNGDINVVMNCAGVPIGGSIVGLSEDIIEKEFAAKVFGTFNLINILKNKKEINSFVNFSSNSAIVSGFGASCYAGANSFEDYISTNYFNTGLNICSINWDRWLQTGMSLDVEKRHKEETGENLMGMNSEEGMNALFDIISMKTSNVVTSINDLNLQIKSLSKINEREDDNSDLVKNESAEVNKQNYLPRPGVSADYIEPRTEIENQLTNIYSDFFRYDKIGVYDNFFELGGDSLKAMRLFAIIKKHFGIRVSIKEIFKRPTIALLSEYLNENVEEIII